MVSRAKPRPKSQRALQAQCDAWNKAHPVGTRVTVTTDGGDEVFCVTRSEAQVLSGHSAVIWVSRLTGCYLLDRVKPVLLDQHRDPKLYGTDRITGYRGLAICDCSATAFRVGLDVAPIPPGAGVFSVAADENHIRVLVCVACGACMPVPFQQGSKR